MAFETCRRKRDFSAAAMPAGRDRCGHGGAFVVQKHAARRLHYDFCLEIGDVLARWAVTRGPSLVPCERRLVVHVEDHPLDYADFEGTVAKGRYGSGAVIVWNRCRWEPEGDPGRGLKQGRFDFMLEGGEAQGALASGAHGGQSGGAARELAAHPGERRGGAERGGPRPPRRGAGVGDLRPHDRGYRPRQAGREAEGGRQGQAEGRSVAGLRSPGARHPAGLAAGRAGLGARDQVRRLPAAGADP